MLEALVEWWSSLVDVMAGLLFGYEAPELRALDADAEAQADAPLATSAALYHRERAAGVDPRLEAFLDWWEDNGPFALVVPPLGGVRTDERAQEALFEARASHARTLAETPHGRGGAVDLAPYTRQGALYAPDYRETSTNLDRYQQLGEAAERFGLQWGGRWLDPDRPHVQVPNWRSLPFGGGNG